MGGRRTWKAIDTWLRLGKSRYIDSVCINVDIDLGDGFCDIGKNADISGMGHGSYLSQGVNATDLD
jgi:hypothetical protein